MSDKIRDCFENLHQHYACFLSTEAIGLYYQLLWMDTDTYNGNGIPLSEISKHTKMSQEKVYSYTLILAEMDLVQFLKHKNAIYFLKPKNRSKQDDIAALERLCGNGIISQHRKQSITDAINAIEKQQDTKRAEASKSKVIDLEDISGFKPDSYASLVRYYYKTLREAFAVDYFSHNEIAETGMLKNIMLGSGDTPEVTKKIIDYIIDKAKKHNKFEQVSSMRFYGHNRHNAHYNLFVINNSLDETSKIVKIDDAQRIENLKELYAYYTKNEGMDHDRAVRQLEGAFDSNIINRFLEGENEKQISVSQTAV